MENGQAEEGETAPQFGPTTLPGPAETLTSIVPRKIVLLVTVFTAAPLRR